MNDYQVKFLGAAVLAAGFAIATAVCAALGPWWLAVLFGLLFAAVACASLEESE